MPRNTDDACEVCRQGQGQPRLLFETDPEDAVRFALCSGCCRSWLEFRDWKLGLSALPRDWKFKHLQVARLLAKHGPDTLTFFFARWVIDRLVGLECDEHSRRQKGSLRVHFRAGSR